jgi:dTDP-4-dehydrorhamnose reductase
MNILVVGRGWVGHKVFTEMVIRGHVVKYVPHTYNIEKAGIKHDWVINCAGFTGKPNVDACEKEKKKTIDANAIYPVLLYEQCKRMGIKFAHFSSGCIYKGTIDTERAEPNYFGSIYSVSKGISDSYLIDKAVVFRVRMPFTSAYEDKNLLTKLTRYANSGKLVEGGPNSISDLDEAISVACNIIERDLGRGAYNLVNRGTVTTHEIAEMLGLEPQWYTPEEFRAVTAADRSNCVIPSYSGMSDVKEALAKRIETFRGLYDWI